MSKFRDLPFPDKHRWEGKEIRYACSQCGEVFINNLQTGRTLRAQWGENSCVKDEDYEKEKGTDEGGGSGNQ